MKLKTAVLPIILFVSMLLSAGCGKETPAPTATPAPTVSATADPADTPVPTPAALPDTGLKEDGGESTKEDPIYEKAKEYIDRPLAELTEAVGEPLSSSYAPSCLGPGRDGELRYEGFTVYTYDNGTSETVLDVIKD